MAMIRHFLAAVFLAAALAACGGGGGGGTATDPAAQSSLPMPARFSSTTDGSELYFLENGKFYVIRLVGVNAPNGTFQLVGTGTREGASFTGSGTMFLYAGEMYTLPHTVTATFSASGSLEFTRQGAGASDPIKTGYVQVAGFDSPAAQSDVAGSYAFLTNQPAMTVDASGAFVLESPSPCRGTIRPHGNVKLYDIEVTGEAGCGLAGHKGIAIRDGSSLLIVWDLGSYLLLNKV